MKARSDCFVRTLVADDWHAWWRLRLRALAEHPDAFGQDFDEIVAAGEQASRDLFDKTIGSPNNRYFGAFVGNALLVGTIGIVRQTRIKMRHRMDILGMYVEPDGRGSRIGAHLLEAAVNHARGTEGVLPIHLTVASHNRSAVTLYLRAGFEPYGQEPRMLMLPDGPVDVDYMVLMLDPL